MTVTVEIVWGGLGDRASVDRDPADRGQRTDLARGDHDRGAVAGGAGDDLRDVDVRARLPRAVKSGDETDALIAFVIWPATVLAVAPDATAIGPEITDTPLMVIP